MKLTKFKLSLLMMFVLIGCSNYKPISDSELYGNSFIKIDDNDFNVPDDWVTHNLFTLNLLDSVFQIQLPPYMRVSHKYPMTNGCSSIIFNYHDTTKINIPANIPFDSLIVYHDTTEIDEFHYGRVGIDYYHHNDGNFNKSDDYLSYSDIEKILSPIVYKALKGGKKILDYTVSDAELLNGPFYTHHNLYDHKTFIAYDAYYRHKGNNPDEGPVSCHIFLLMNKTDATVLTVSYHDKDSVLFDNLFNVVKTFKWTKYN